MVDTKNTIFIIGISPRNPYYSNPENIQFAIDHLKGMGKDLCLFAPGQLDCHNFLSYGYNEEAALRKAAQSEVSIAAAMDEICDRNKITLMTCSEAFSNESYQGALKKLSSLYVSNDNFREDVRTVTAVTIESHAHVNSRDKKRIQKMGVTTAIDKGKDYLLGELSWVMAATQILGAKSVVYHYHRPWLVFEKLISGAYDGNVRPELKFRILCNPSAKL